MRYHAKLLSESDFLSHSYRQALDVCVANGDLDNAASACTNIAVIVGNRGEMDEAIRMMYQSLEDRVELGAGILARLLGIGPEADANAQFAEKIVFELSQPEREVTTDVALSGVLDPFLVSLKYRADNRYFLIRECRWATAMTYRLSKERVVALGGETALHEALTVGARLKTVNERLYEIDCDFSEAMRVMSLPEEIKPISAGLGGDEPELGRVPVTEPLVWEN